MSPLSPLIHQLAQETAEKILLSGRDISMTMDEWKRRRPDLAKDLDEEVEAMTPPILVALRQAQQVQRDENVAIWKAVDELLAVVQRTDEHIAWFAPISRLHELATLRSQETP